MKQFSISSIIDGSLPECNPRDVYVLTGEMDIFTAATTCRILDMIHGPAVIDLSSIRLLPAAGLTELCHLANRVGRKKVVLRGACPHVRNILNIVAFEQLFLIET